jgi:hypothetical protein
MLAVGGQTICTIHRFHDFFNLDQFNFSYGNIPVFIVCIPYPQYFGWYLFLQFFKGCFEGDYDLRIPAKLKALRLHTMHASCVNVHGLKRSQLGVVWVEAGVTQWINSTAAIVRESELTCPYVYVLSGQLSLSGTERKKLESNCAPAGHLPAFVVVYLFSCLDAS